MEREISSVELDFCVNTKLCFVEGFCLFFEHHTENPKNVPTLRQTDSSFLLIPSIGRKKVRKRKERQERKKKPSRVPPVSFPTATWFCTIKSQ